MDAVLMELARPRFQAASKAWFVIDGGAHDLEIPREAVFIVKAGLTLTPATAGIWTGILGVLVDTGSNPRLPGKMERLLVDVASVVALRVTD